MLLGDQCQLPPTTLCRHPAAELPSRPLFNRLIADGIRPLLLDTQYRMHPAIAQLPADLIYGGRLRTGVAASDRPPPVGFAWPRPDWPVALVPVGGRETAEGSSKLNRAEAEQTAAIVAQLLSAGLTGAQNRVERQSRRLAVQGAPWSFGH